MFGELMKWNPSQELSSWHRDIDDLFSRFFEGPETSLGGWVPRIETFRKDNEYVVRLDLPGVDPKDVQVQAEDNVLSISGERDRAERAGLSRNILWQIPAESNVTGRCRNGQDCGPL
jgi:HSP20 family protein